MNFDKAFEVLIGHEGGYVNHPQDPGGETKFGISKRTYPWLDIKGITLDQAKEIYRRDFWNSCSIEQLPNALRFDVFDACVNHGPGNARRLLQRALGVADDGIIGPITLKTAREADPNIVLARFAGYRLYFFTNLTTFNTFGRGWTRRVADNLLQGVNHV